MTNINNKEVYVCGWCSVEVSDGMEFCSDECRDKSMEEHHKDMEQIRSEEETLEYEPCPHCGCIISVSQLHCVGSCSECEDVIMSSVVPDATGRPLYEA